MILYSHREIFKFGKLTFLTGGKAMLIITGKDIKEVFTMRDAIETDKKAFVLHTQGNAKVPLRINLDTDKKDGQIMFMPAYVGGDLNMAGVKIVSCFVGNPEKGLPVIPADVALIDGTTGVVCAVINGTVLTQMRTAAISGAATDLLANPDSKVGALFGTGGQAPAQLEALMTARDLEEVRIFDVKTDRIEPFVEKYTPLAKKYGTKLIAAKNPKETVTDADVITCVTISADPVFDADDIKAGAHINGVGSYTPDKRELPEEILHRASSIFVDNFEAVTNEAGDFVIPVTKKTFSLDRIRGELGELILGKVKGREAHDDITVMKTVGFATLDIVAAAEIYKKAKSAGMGTEIDI